MVMLSEPPEALEPSYREKQEPQQSAVSLLAATYSVSLSNARLLL